MNHISSHLTECVHSVRLDGVLYMSHDWVESNKESLSSRTKRLEWRQLWAFGLRIRDPLVLEVLSRAFKNLPNISSLTETKCAKAWVNGENSIYEQLIC